MKTKKRYFVLPIIILAIAIMGVVATQPANSLTMDVNPSIEIVTNRLDRVVEINPLNDDARELLKSFNPKDKNLERTVNDLVDLMILTGHIRGGEDNFVMITVADNSVDGRLVNKVNRAIQAMLENKQIEATVLNQAIASSDRGVNQTGVQLAAQRIQQLDGGLTAEEIESMTVKELIQYSNEQGIAIESLFRVAIGDVNQSAVGRDIISRQEAERIALDRINGEVIKLELDDLHDSDPEYEIKILADGVIYEIEIDAYTGRIKEYEREDKANLTSGKGKRNIISKEQAANIALGLVDGEIVKLELGEDDGNPEYEIKVIKDGIKYEIEIDARTGNVKEFEQEDGKNVTSAKGNKNIISKEQASNIALGLVNGEIVKLKLDDDDDDPEYEIKIRKDGIIYEIELDARTGEVKEFEIDDDDKSVSVQGKQSNSKPQQTSQPSQTPRPTQTPSSDSKQTSRERISPDQAKAIALGLTGGGRITEFELDDDEYEIEIESNGKEYEIEIDAYTGKVLDFEVEDDD